MTDQQNPKLDEQKKDLEERRKRFGIWADCDLEVKPGRKVSIIVDNPLPDDDRLIFETNLEKVIAKTVKAGAGKLLAQEDLSFFEGK